MVVLADCTKMLLRRRLSRLSADWQMLHWQATMGTPPLVPVPKKVMISGVDGISLVKVTSTALGAGGCYIGKKNRNGKI
jgi:hypothetical protein